MGAAKFLPWVGTAAGLASAASYANEHTALGNIQASLTTAGIFFEPADWANTAIDFVHYTKDPGPYVPGNRPTSYP